MAPAVSPYGAGGRDFALAQDSGERERKNPRGFSAGMEIPNLLRCAPLGRLLAGLAKACIGRR